MLTRRTAKSPVWRTLLLASLIVMALVGVVAAVVVYRAPMWVVMLAGRTTLRVAGFDRVTAQAARGPIVYFRAGTGSTIVFLHGVNDQAGTWARVAPVFAKSHRVVVADLAGHGDSAPQSGPLRFDDLIEGVQAIVDAERASQPVVLIGNSLGGFLSLVHAQRHPEQVALVIAVNGAVIRGGNMEAARLLLPQSRNDARRLMNALLSRASPQMPDFVLDDLLRRSPTSPLARLASASQDEIDRWLADDRLKTIQTPVVLIWGAEDGLMPMKYAEEALTRLPHSYLDTIPACGHMPQRECPAELIPHLEAALSKAQR